MESCRYRNAGLSLQSLYIALLGQTADIPTRSHPRVISNKLILNRLEPNEIVKWFSRGVYPSSVKPPIDENPGVDVPVTELDPSLPYAKPKSPVISYGKGGYIHTFHL